MGDTGYLLQPSARIHPMAGNLEQDVSSALLHTLTSLLLKATETVQMYKHTEMRDSDRCIDQKVFEKPGKVSRRIRIRDIRCANGGTGR